MSDMASYESGAYEALHWAWLMLKKVRKDPDSIDKARAEIKDKLSLIGNSGKTDFLTELNQ